MNDSGDASAEAPAARSSRADGVLRVADAFLTGQRPDGRVGGERHQLLVCIKESALHPGGVSAEAEGATLARETWRPRTINGRSVRRCRRLLEVAMTSSASAGL